VSIPSSRGTISCQLLSDRRSQPVRLELKLEMEERCWNLELAASRMPAPAPEKISEQPSEFGGVRTAGYMCVMWWRAVARGAWRVPLQ
jgi:hypothetical protein